ncbi:C1 family peptidase [Niabella insulamsoli]|uniref:C1 family peptidase n=1 Tax=Niabella insulamsoli TaxID=3144874 RepID=UPI0031FC28BF
MPIRMTDDPEDQQNDYNNDRGGSSNSSGGGGGLFSLLPLLLSLFKGKGIIVLLVAGAALWFFMGKGGGGCGNMNIADVARQAFSQSGYSYNPDEFNKASIYEGLEDDPNKNPLPEAVSLLRFAPRRGDQGAQGSCVAWSSAYAAQTILTAAATGNDPNSIAFSPSYLYNQIRLGNDCQGSYIQKAMEAMKVNGGVAISQFPYTDQSCSNTPGGATIQMGRQNTIHGFTRLTEGDNLNQISVRAVKEHLSKDAPVVIGMMVGESFMQGMMGKDLWQPQGIDQSQVGMGGHAMCVIGYDDRKYGGAFQIMNSWSPQWGNNGIAWVRYRDFKQYVREAYGIDPLPKTAAVAAQPLECSIGLVDNVTRQYIKLKSAGNNSFQTVNPIAVGTRFKMEVKNATPCYIYIFGQETDGSSYVLFPYLKPGESKSKHAPYCGITGYRLFPKAQSMEADNIGNRDYIAIITSKKELSYNLVNEAISNSQQASFAGKVNDALRGTAVTASQTAGAEGNVYFKVNANNNQAVATIVAFDKK